MPELQEDSRTSPVVILELSEARGSGRGLWSWLYRKETNPSWQISCSYHVRVHSNLTIRATDDCVFRPRNTKIMWQSGSDAGYSLLRLRLDAFHPQQTESLKTATERRTHGFLADVGNVELCSTRAAECAFDRTHIYFYLKNIPLPFSLPFF